MTTLPQNTPMRMPRPNPGAITIPGAGSGGGMMPAPGMQAQAPLVTAGDVWRIFRANLWIIVSLLVLSAVAGYVINNYWLVRYRSFTATGFLQVQPAMGNANPLSGAQQGLDINTIEIEKKTNAQLLRHESLVSEVFKNPDSRIKSTSWFAQFDGSIQKAKEKLGEDLVVSPIPESKLIAIAMSYSVPKDCADIVYDIGQQHIRNQRRVTQDEQLKRSTVLSSMGKKLDDQLTDRQRELRDKQIQLNMDGMGTPGRLSVKEIQMQSFVQQQLELNLKGQTIRTQLDAMSQQNQRGEVPAVIRQQVDKEALVQDLTRQLTYAEMQQPSAGAAMNPSNMRAQQQIAMLREKLESTRAQAIADATVAATESLQNELAQNDQKLKTISGEVEKMKQEMGVLNNALAVFLTSKDEERLLREQKKQVEDSLEMIRQTVNQQDVSGVAWAQLPQPPEAPTFPRLQSTMAAAVALGLLLSVGIAFLREVTDTTVRSPRDIHRIGNMNFLGMIPHEDDDPQAAGARLPLVIFDAPTSMMADQLRQVRTRLQYAASLDTTRSILVTSPGPNDGKTAIACNLAAGLALNGRRILMVDADFRRPELHKIFEQDNARGFCDVLQNVELFEECVRETQVPNLSVLTSGPRPGNATELLESQLLVDFIERALDEFDHVIFDSGSIMVVSEAIALAPRVDGVVTVVRARSNSRGLLQRMRDTLRQLKAEHLGIILNGVRAQGGGYYGRNIKTYYAYQEQA